MPYDVVWQSDNFVAGSLGHLGKALRFSLVLKGVAGEVDAWRQMSAELRMNGPGNVKEWIRGVRARYGSNLIDARQP